MLIETEDYLQVKDAVPHLRKLGIKRSEMWLKLQVMYNRVPSIEVFSSRVMHKDDLKKLATDYKSRLVKCAMVALLLLSLPRFALAAPVAGYVNAIWVVEGGSKAAKPYGILSVPCESKAECRKICENTVRNNLRRWNAAGKPGTFISFLGDRYCPPSVDPQGNKNWKSNMRKILNEK